MGDKAVIEKLGRIDLFSTLKDDAERMNKLASIVSWRECKTGDQVISEGVEGMNLYPWRLFFPALAMVIFLFSMNFLGDGLRDALDPQSKNKL